MPSNPILEIDGKRYEVIGYRVPIEGEVVPFGYGGGFAVAPYSPFPHGKQSRPILKELPPQTHEAGELERDGDWWVTANPITRPTLDGTQANALIDAACAVVNSARDGGNGVGIGVCSHAFFELRQKVQPFLKPKKKARFQVNGNLLVTDDGEEVGVAATPEAAKSFAAKLNSLHQEANSE